MATQVYFTNGTLSGVHLHTQIQLQSGKNK